MGKRGPRPTTLESLPERFWARVAIGPADACWPWKPSRYRGGINPATGWPRMKTPRIAWYLYCGEWPPDSLFVCHKCDNPRCVNPAHLWLGTQKENIADAKAKGRLVTPFVRGHRFGEAVRFKVGEHRGREFWPGNPFGVRFPQQKRRAIE